MPISEQKHTAASIPNATAGKGTWFLDSADDLWKWKDENGAVVAIGAAGAPVQSVFARTGAVTALQADYDGFFLTPAEGNAAYAPIGEPIAAAHIIDAIAAHAASAIAFTPTGTIAATDVQAAIAEVAAEATVVSSVFGRTGAVTALQADYDGFFLTPAEGDAAYGRLAAANTWTLGNIFNGGDVVIGTGAALDAGVRLQVVGQPSEKTAIFRANATTPGNIIEAQNSAGTSVGHLTPAGQLQLPVTGSGGGLLIGTNNLYELVAGSNLKTDGNFNAGGVVRAQQGLSTEVIVGDYGIGVAAILLGGNTNLYQFAANVLKTDAAFVGATTIDSLGFEYRANGTKVVGARGAAVADTTDVSDTATQLNLLLARLRASTGHGLIA